MTSTSHDPMRSANPYSQPKSAVETFLDKYELHLELLASLLIIILGWILWDQSKPPSLWRSVAPSVVATGIVAFLLFLVYGRLFRERQQEDVRRDREIIGQIANKQETQEADLARAVDEAARGALLQFDRADKLGLVTFYRDRPTRRINEEALLAKKKLHILEISLNTMRDIGPVEWSACKAEEVQVILLDPYYPDIRSPYSKALAVQRDHEEDQPVGTILGEIHRVLLRFPTEWFTPSDPRVKLAQTMPTLSYFRIDDSAYVSHYVHKQVGEATLHIKLREGEYMTILEKHFQALWRDPARVRPADPTSVSEHY